MPPPFDGFVEDTKRVSPTCLVAFERNRYSVPASFANRPVSMVEILSLVLHHDEEAVLCSVELALESGVVSKEHVLNLLSRLLETDSPAPIDTPTHLTLLEEPKANVSRYDHLRGEAHAS
jgi:hypothetical protein